MMHHSKRLLSLLLGLRIQGGASFINSSTSSLSYLGANNSNYYQHYDRALFSSDSNNNDNMSDEVAAAKAAAAEYKSSDADGELLLI